MAKKKAICTNIDCSEYKKIVELETGAEMICPSCGQPMKSADNAKGAKKKASGSGKGKMAAIAVIAAAVLGGGGYGIYSAFSGDKPETEKPAPKPIPVKAEEPEVAKSDTVAKPVEKEVINTGVVNLDYGKYDGELKNGLPHGKGKITFSKLYALPQGGKAQQGEVYKGTFEDGKPVQLTKVAPEQKTYTPQSGHGTVDLGYATYTGDLKHGKPHGNGVLIYRSSRRIVPSKDFVASPGDRFEGEFRDGRIAGGIGYWKHDGNITAIKL